MKDDIGEENDLSKEMPEKAEEMRAKLHAWYQKNDAKFLQSKNGNTPWRPAYLKK